MNDVNLVVPCQAKVDEGRKNNEFGTLVHFCAGKCTLHAKTNSYTCEDINLYARFYIFILHKVHKRKKEEEKQAFMIMNLLLRKFIHSAPSCIGGCHA